MSSRDVAVLGVGMHEWGKWGKPFVEYGVAAARDALVGRRHHLAGRRLHRRRRDDPKWVCRLRRRRDVRAGPRLDGCPRRDVLRRMRGRCDSDRHRAVAHPRRALRRGARRRCGHHAEGLPGADVGVGRERSGLPPLPPARRDEPHVLRALRAAPHGAVRRDGRGLRARQGEEREARTQQPACALQEGVHGRRCARVADGVRSAAATPDLRDVGRRRGRRAQLDGLRRVAGREGSGTHRRRLDGHAHVSEHRDRDAELLDRLRRRPSLRPSSASGTRSRRPRTNRPASARTISTSPRSTTCRPRSSWTGTRTSACASRARPNGSSATATQRSADASRSIRPAGSRASVRRCPRRRSRRCASSSGSCAARPTDVRSKARRSA